MLARMEEAFGRKLPIASLYANATVQALSCLVTDAVAETNESPLGLVQAGHGKRPFFFLHGDFNGGGFYCRNLAKHLDPDQPFYVIHPFGLAGQPAPTRVEDMAAAHRQLLQSVQPEGPYLLGGYCNGALEVYEMAQQLHAAGQKVDLLLLIDPPAPNQEQLLAPPGESLQPDPTTLPQDQRQLLLARLFLRAMANYCPRPYPGPVSLFRSGIQDRPSATPNPNWNRLIPKIERFNFKSAHLTAITRDVAEIGKQIQLCLDVAHLA
jgi:thioesterase domain-containing protein